MISAIYAGLVAGTLDPYNQTVNLSSVSPLRDLPPLSIPSMLSTLHEWSSRCGSTLADLERQIAKIKADALKRHREEAEWAAQVEKLVEIKGQPGKKEQAGEPGFFEGLGRKLGGGKRNIEGDSGDGMDLDDDDSGEFGDNRGGRNKKRGLFGP